jgi:hypothetical protein
MILILIIPNLINHTRGGVVGKSGPIKSRDPGNGQTMVQLSVGFVLSVAHGHFEAPSPQSNTPRSAVLCAPFGFFQPMEI